MLIVTNLCREGSRSNLSLVEPPQRLLEDTKNNENPRWFGGLQELFPDAD